MVFNRQESRLLEFVCLSVIVAININSFTCNIMEVVTYLIAVIFFIVFNVFRIAESIKFLRLIFFIPLVAAYLPFFIFKKELKTVWLVLFTFHKTADFFILFYFFFWNKIIEK